MHYSQKVYTTLVHTFKVYTTLVRPRLKPGDFSLRYSSRFVPLTNSSTIKGEPKFRIHTPEKPTVFGWLPMPARIVSSISGLWYPKSTLYYGLWLLMHSQALSSKFLFKILLCYALVTIMKVAADVSCSRVWSSWGIIGAGGGAAGEGARV